MHPKISITTKWMAASALFLACLMNAQGPGRGNPTLAVFAALDTNKDGSLTQPEMTAAWNAWFATWDSSHSGALTQEQVETGLAAQFPAYRPPVGGVGGFNPVGNFTPMTAKPESIAAMAAALPTNPAAKPQRARKILVLAHTGAGGFVHTSIPLAAKMVELLGNQGNLWSTTVTWDPVDINAANLKQYDAIFLDSTTGCFLDSPDSATTAARRKAFLDFVRGGKGVAGIHAATDSYHSDCLAAEQNAISMKHGIAGQIATQIFAQADKNKDHQLSQQEFTALAGDWFAKMDKNSAGKLSQADFAAAFNSVALPSRPRPAPGGEAAPILQWPEFNRLIGGYFKFHWSDPQLITVRIDDPKSPLTAMFHGAEFEIHDETYTFEQSSFSRTNVHVLTSIDYAKMSAEDKAKERNPRTDQDYALSYIHREGKGRVFYEGHGHSDRVYAITPMLEHMRAGIQYALGDLKADDSPSQK